MAAGIGMPVNLELLVDAVDLAPQLRRKTHAEAIDDRRFAEAIYRTGLIDSVMESMSLQEPGSDGKALTPP